MTPDFVVDFGRQAIEVTLLLAMPMLGLGLVVGLMVSIFQATTQIQEMTLTFVPKVLVVFISLLVFMPFMLHEVIDYTHMVMDKVAGGG